MMDGGSGSQIQGKNDRSRMKWTPYLDKVFVDSVVKQIQLGKRANNVFTQKTWNQIREDFNKQTNLDFNSNQLRKHFDVLRIRFQNLKTDPARQDLAVYDSGCCGFDTCDDIWARPETVGADCPIYDQLCTIFGETTTAGKYAQSSHFEGIDKSTGTNTAGSTPESRMTKVPEHPPSSNIMPLSSEQIVKDMAERKRKRESATDSIFSVQSRRDQELNNAMAEALRDMIEASKRRTAVELAVHDDRFSISDCIKALDEINGITEQLYLAALDLFEEPNLRESFLSLQSNMIRLTWLEGKCDRSFFYF